MPFCEDCQRWFPSRVPRCEACGGAMTGQPPPTKISRTPVPSSLEEVWDNAGNTATLPDADPEPMSLDEADRLAAQFDEVRLKAAGRHAAPRSWLPASSSRVAMALDLVHAHLLQTEDGSGNPWPAIRNSQEAIVDLQAFLPDEDAAATDLPATRIAIVARCQAALDQVRWAQAVVISMLRADEKVLGAHVALEGIDITIGSARRSLQAVDRYKQAQALAIPGIVLFPVCLLIGLILGAVLFGVSLSAIIIVVMLGVGSVYLGPAYGWRIGALSSDLDQLALRQDRAATVRLGRKLASAITSLLFFGGPIAISLIIVWVLARVGAP